MHVHLAGLCTCCTAECILSPRAYACAFGRLVHLLYGRMHSFSPRICMCIWQACALAVRQNAFFLPAHMHVHLAGLCTCCTAECILSPRAYACASGRLVHLLYGRMHSFSPRICM